MKNELQKSQLTFLKSNNYSWLFIFSGKLANILRISAAIVLVAGLMFSDAVAQEQIEVSGTVTASDGDPLPGVTIVVEGTNTGTTSNMDGNYSLRASSNGVLVFSFIGYEQVREQINGRNTIDIVMQETIANLDELIVTGYSSQRRGDITGAVSSVNIESIDRQTSASVLDRLDGKVPGVTVQTSGSPGSRNTVRIRGISSFQNNDPLYIIDGTPVQDDYANWLNPSDIESIQVLKDASAASIYGSRANNGVIIIETKKGRAGQPQVSLDIRTGIAEPVRGYDDFVITDALEYHEVVKRSFENAGQTVPTNIYGDPNNPSIPNYIYPQRDNVDESSYSFPDNLIMRGSSGTNWWDEVFGPAVQQNYNLSVAGGSDDHNYNVSFNFLDQEGTAAYNRFRRGTVRINTEFDLGFVTIGENVSIATDQSYGGITNDPGGYAEGGIMGKNILMQPVVPVYDINGWWASGKANTLGNQGNPLKAAYYSAEGPSRSARMFGNVFGRFNIMEKVLATSRLGFNISENSYRFYNPVAPENSEPTSSNGIGEGNSVNTDYTWSNTIQYIDTYLGDHNVDLLIGHEANSFTGRSINGSLNGLVSTAENARYINDALGETKNVSSGGFKSSLLSVFGKVAYNYQQKYFFDITVRRDGSSRLGEANQWGTFPAASIGWRVSNESFLQDSDLISNLMIRAGWGITGNQSIPAGRTVDQFGGGTGDTFYNISGDGSNISTGYRQTVRGNPDIKWEENENVNVGLDLEMFDGRFNFALDIYQRDTNDLLFAPQLPATAGGAAPPIVNIGQMRNTGFDFTLGTRGEFGDGINWTLSFNGSHYQNEIRKIDGSVDFFFAGTTLGRHQFTPINQLGQPIGAFYGLESDGIFMSDEEVNNHATQDGAAPGRLRFVDVNGDGTITADDRTIIGSPHPDFTGGLDFGLQYKSWDFNTTFFASIGNDIYDVQKEFYVFRTFSTTVRRDLLTESAVVENGQVTNDPKYPRIDLDDTFSGGTANSFYVEDGSYLRLRNLQIGYTLPGGIIPGLRNARIYVQGENLFTITGYDGLDPSLPTANISSASGDTRDQYMGIDRGSYPSNRILSFGINATF
ncbi:MAG: TonB-dependent receptor [Balneolaceae bacterium]